MKIKVLLLTSLLALGLTGLLHGRITDRWGYSDTLQAAVGKLSQVPLSAGDYDGTVMEIQTDRVATKGSGAYVSARFVDRVRGETVFMTLVCGRPGPLSLHPPTICFPAHGYAQQGPDTRTTVSVPGGARSADFMQSEFVRNAGTGTEHIHICWAYGLNGSWTVPANPRIAWARQPAVYKLYVFRQSVGADAPLAEDPLVPFLQTYLPELQKVLSGA
jgi:hypothetical protein